MDAVHHTCFGRSAHRSAQAHAAAPVLVVDNSGIEGQGIAWDDMGSRSTTLWAIGRDNSEVISYAIPIDEITDPQPSWDVLGPGQFPR